MAEGHPDTGPRVGTLVQLGGVSIAAAAWVLARSTFYEGYFDALGVPSSLGLSPPVGTASLILSAVLGWFTVEGFWKFVRFDNWFGRGPIRGLFSGTLTTAILFFGVGAAFEWFGFPTLGKWAGIGGFAATSAWLWARPLVSGPRGMTYRQRVVALEASDKAAGQTQRTGDDPDQSDEIFSRVIAWAGPGVRAAVIVLLLSPFIGYHFGRNAAVRRERWIVVEHPALPSPTPESAWVLLSTAGDRLWVVATRNRQIDATVLAVEAAGGRLRETKLGQLRRATPGG